jgi:hypothetical protein
MTEGPFTPRVGDVVVLPGIGEPWDPGHLYRILSVSDDGSVAYESFLPEDRARESTPYGHDLPFLQAWGLRLATEADLP